MPRRYALIAQATASIPSVAPPHSGCSIVSAPKNRPSITASTIMGSDRRTNDSLGFRYFGLRLNSTYEGRSLPYLR